MTPIPVFDSAAVFAAVPPAEAIARTRTAFERHHAGDWVMPAKTYLDAPPDGDFRAMPARGEGLAILKWVTSFPGNSARGLPVVTGALLVSSAETGELLAIVDCAAVTSLRTGAAAAVSAQVLARDGAATVGVIGCGVNGAWAARCLAAAGYGPGICADPRAEAASALAGELGWQAGERAAAAAQDVVVTVTPGTEPVIGTADLRMGQHFAVLGADAHGKAEVDPDVLQSARLFCDEWEQAAAGGELAGAVAAGRVVRDQVTELGAVLAGAPGRTGPHEITLFDSTGLAIQDLGHRARRARRPPLRGRSTRPTVDALRPDPLAALDAALAAPQHVVEIGPDAVVALAAEDDVAIAVHRVDPVVLAPAAQAVAAAAADDPVVRRGAADPVVAGAALDPVLAAAAAQAVAAAEALDPVVAAPAADPLGGARALQAVVAAGALDPRLAAPGGWVRSGRVRTVALARVGDEQLDVAVRLRALARGGAARLSVLRLVEPDRAAERRELVRGEGGRVGPGRDRRPRARRGPGSCRRSKACRRRCRRSRSGGSASASRPRPRS